MSLWSALEIEEWAKEKIKQRDEELEKKNSDNEKLGISKYHNDI